MANASTRWDVTDAPGGAGVAEAGTPAVGSRSEVRSVANFVSLCLSAALVAVGLLAPLLAVIGSGVSLTGYTQESTGYRYFHSLRLLYGEGERPWIPQGHTVGLVHLGIQLLLTAAGYAPTELFPRIDVWTTLAAGLPHVAATAAFAWAVTPLRAWHARLAAAGVVLAAAWLSRDDLGVHLLAPDYPSWGAAFALLTAGWLLRLTQRPRRPRLADAALLGTFAAACLTTKPTFAVLALVVGGVMLGPVRPAGRWLRYGAVAAVVCAGLSVLITVSYYLGSVAATLDYYLLLRRFIAGIPNERPLSAWLVEFAFGRPPDTMTAYVLLLPVLAAAALVPSRRRGVAAWLFAGALLYLYLAYRRDSPITLVELSHYLLVVAIVGSVRVAGPAVRPWLDRLLGGRMASGTVLAFNLAVAAGLCARVTWIADQNTAGRVAQMATLDEGGAAIDRILAEVPGQTLFLFPDSRYRPLTVHSAVAKGGMDLWTHRWGDSRLLVEMFPGRHYVTAETPTADGPPELALYDQVVFTAVDSQRGLGWSIRQLYETFGVTTTSLVCRPGYEFPYPDWGGAIMVCRPRVEPLPLQGRVTALYIPTVSTLTPAEGSLPSAGLPASAWPERPFSIGPTQLLYAGASNDLWRMDADGHLTRLAPAEGQSMHVALVGAWGAGRRIPLGLPAEFRRGRWVLDISSMPLVNRNHRFEEGTADDPIPGFAVSPGGPYISVTRLEDEDGPYARIEITEALPGVALIATDLLMDLDQIPEDTPLTFRAQVRFDGAVGVQGTMPSVVRDDGQVSAGLTATRAPNRWITLTLRGVRIRAGAPVEPIFVTVQDGNPPTTLEVRELSVFIGIHP